MIRTVSNVAFMQSDLKSHFRNIYMHIDYPPNQAQAPFRGEISAIKITYSLLRKIRCGKIQESFNSYSTDQRDK